MTPAANNRATARVLRDLTHRSLTAVGAVALTLAFFLVLPLIQTIHKPPAPDLQVTRIDTADVPPPPPPPEETPEEEEEKEDPPPPELAEDPPPLELSQLELALDPGAGGWGGADFAVKLSAATADTGAGESLFSMSDLDQRPRAVHQPSPVMSADLRRRTPGVVTVIFIVDQRGRVENPIVQRSSDPVFDRAALAAVKQWKFEPGKRSGQPVRFRMRVDVTFPKGQ